MRDGYTAFNMVAPALYSVPQQCTQPPCWPLVRHSKMPVATARLAAASTNSSTRKPLLRRQSFRMADLSTVHIPYQVAAGPFSGTSEEIFFADLISASETSP